MDDLAFGQRNKRGDWAPAQPLALAPIWSWPWQPGRIARWLVGYLWPWNLFHLATTLLFWWLVIPGADTLRTLSWAWVLPLWAANAVGLALFYAAFEWRYYVRRVQGQRFKYNGRFPADQPSDVFWFKRQNVDNILRGFLIGVPIATAIEVLLLWSFASGRVPTLSWAEHGPWLAAVLLLAPVLHELHFFVIHRLIHLGPLYRWVHSVHHNSVNPSPWSSLSMHPVESAAYFGVALWMLLVPSHPFIAVFMIHVAGFGAIVGHIGFHKLELGEHRAADSHAYAHYLHHKHFDVNFCDNGVLPLDHWFGTWHDGSPEGERRMQQRYRRKLERLNKAA